MNSSHQAELLQCDFCNESDTGLTGWSWNKVCKTSLVSLLLGNPWRSSYAEGSSRCRCSSWWQNSWWRNSPDPHLRPKHHLRQILSDATAVVIRLWRGDTLRVLFFSCGFYCCCSYCSIFVTSAKEVMFSSLFVCLSVYLFVSSFAQKLPNGFAWKFLGRLAMSHWTTD